MNSPWKDKAAYETIVRYMLGGVMLAYGLIKLLRIQFIIPSYLWMEQLRNLDGVGLAWAFLGHCAWLSVLLGALETMSGLLLLFRKTRLLGALLLFPILLNVFLINVAFGFLPSMRIFTAVLLLMNAILLSLHYRLFTDFFQRIINHRVSSKRIGLEWVINVGCIGIVIYWVVNPRLNYIQQRNILTGDWYHQKSHYWLVKDTLQEEESQANMDEKQYLRYYFQPDHEVYAFLPGNSQALYRQYDLDEGNQLLTITDPNNPEDKVQGKFQMLDSATLEWSIGKGQKKLNLIRKEIR